MFAHSNNKYLNDKFNASKALPGFVPHVLLVEDTEIIQRLHEKILHDLGCAVTVAKTGEEAIFFYEREFDLVLMDIELPDFSGIEATRKILKHYPNINTPIFACTAYNDESVKQKCLTAGMNDFVTKPAAKETFERLIQIAYTMRYRNQSNDNL